MSKEDSRERQAIDFEARIVSWVIIAAVVGYAVLWMFDLRHHGTASEALQQLQGIQSSSFDQINVFSEYGERSIGTVRDPAAVTQFVDTLKVAKPYDPNHPYYTQTWYILLQGDHNVEVQCNLLDSDNGVVICRFANRFGQSELPPGGHVASRQLRPWLIRHGLLPN